MEAHYNCAYKMWISLPGVEYSDEIEVKAILNPHEVAHEMSGIAISISSAFTVYAK